MKRCMKLGLLFAVIMCLALTTACAKKKPAPVEPAATTDQGAADQALEAQRQAEAQKAEEAKAAFLNTKIYFAFDDSSLSSEAQGKLNDQANWIKDNAGATVVVEGYCDERGTDEYNLALGSRRAESVKNYLVNLGVDAARLSTISYGEERPAVPGHDEEAWAQNRRVEFSLQ